LRVLIVTGILAEAEVRRHTEGLSHSVDVYTLPVTVAAFITPSYAAKQLSGVDLSDYDMILLRARAFRVRICPTFPGVREAPMMATDLSLNIASSFVVAFPLWVLPDPGTNPPVGS